MTVFRKRITEWKNQVLILLSDPDLEERSYYEDRFRFYNEVLKVCDQADREDWEECEPNGKVKPEGEK